MSPTDFEKTSTEKRKEAHKRGLKAEKTAVRWLRMKGYQILAERYKNAFGEVDILAKKGNVLALVEVKARKTYRECAESITPAKQQRQIKAAKSLLAYPGVYAKFFNSSQVQVRFDVMMIRPWRLPRHMINAFQEN